MNTIAQFWSAIAPFAITGTIVSLIVQATKQAFEKSGHKMLWTLVVSVVGGIILQFTSLIPTNWLTTIIAVLASANTVYLIVIQWFEDSSTTKPTPTAQPTTPTAPAGPTASA